MDNYIFDGNEAELDAFLDDHEDDQESLEAFKNELEHALEVSRQALIRNIKNRNDDYLMHYGVGADDNPPGRGSGRYPKGSGENPNQHELYTLAKQVKELKDQGLTPKQIAKALQFKSTTQLRAQLSIESERKKIMLKSEVPRLKSMGLTNKEIQERLGISDGSVRNYLNEDREIQAGRTRTVAETIRKEVDAKNYIDVGTGANLSCGVTDTRFKTAVAMLEAEGYKKYYIKVEQLGNPGKFTTIKVLGKPDSDGYHELPKDLTKIHNIESYFVENGKTVLGLEPPRSIDSDRIHVRWADEVGPDGATGKQRDGIIQIREGVDDISLGKSRYSQVRIAVDGTHYLKGMAVYGDPSLFPPGCDIIVNSNKPVSDDPHTAFKKMKTNRDGTINEANPFGAAIKPFDKELNAGGQSYYIDKETGEKKLSFINKVNDQGDYGEWKKTISAQMLSKQPPELVAKQLSLTLQDRVSEYKDIMAIDNPAVRRYFLESFAEDCDAAASHLKAKAFPGQTTNVLISMPSLKEDECYSPNYENGERLALVRYPHAGPQEIVVVRNNTRNKEGIYTLGNNAPDAIGLHPSQYPKLSGADSDGDTVIAIPLSKTRVLSKPMFRGMENFDPNIYEYDGPVIKSQTKQTEMGKVTNLIADMGIFGAKDDEMVRAIKHSQVVIDAEKHHLDWKKSEEDFGIAELKKRYQHGGGASTLITRAGSEYHTPQRKPGTYVEIDPLTGKKKKTRGVNPHTGERIWEETGETYTKLITPKKKAPYTKTITRMETITKMDATSDAMTLLSSKTNPHPVEVLYGEYANSLKRMANESRREAVNTPKLKYDPGAAKEYAPQVRSINAKLVAALKNAPRERMAQAIGTTNYRAQLDANPDIKDDKAYTKRLKGQCLQQARDLTGAHKPRIVPTPLEIEAINKGAISDSKVRTILDNSEDDAIRKAFTPKRDSSVSDAMVALAKSMARNGYTNADIAERLGVSNSTVSGIINS